MASPEPITASHTSDQRSNTEKSATQATPVIIVSSSGAGEQSSQPKSALWRRIVSLVWDTADGDPEYRRYVQRLDLFVLYVRKYFHYRVFQYRFVGHVVTDATRQFSPTVCLGYFIKYLDQSNYSEFITLSATPKILIDDD